MTYRYKEQDLVEVIDTDGNSMHYTYDSIHNMTSITYPNQSKMVMTYEPKTQLLSTLKRPGEQTVTYKYESNPENPNYDYWTIVDDPSSDSKQPDRYDYLIKVIEGSGIQYRAQTRSRVNDVETLKKFNESSQPTLIRKKGVEEKLRYDSQGKLVSKTRSDETWVKYKYHPVHAKVSEATTEKGVTTFHYDKKSVLRFANKGKPEQVEFRYDDLGRLSSISTSEIDFVYNYSRVNIIEKLELGEHVIRLIHGGYRDRDLKSVESDSPESRKMVLTQFDKFLSLLELALVEREEDYESDKLEEFLK